MIDRLAYVYRPIRSTDIEGGFYYTFETPFRLFINLAHHDNQPFINIRKGSVPVLQEDVLHIEGEFYRICQKITSNVTEYYRIQLEKIERPIGL